MNEDERRQNLRRLKMTHLIEDFGLPESRFDDLRLGKFEVVQGTEEAFRVTCQYLYITEDLKNPSEIYENEEAIQGWYDRQPFLHHFLTFVGQCGRGKTHLALAIGIWFIEKDEQKAIYYQVPVLLNKLRQGFEHNTELTYSEIMVRCQNADLLILDDLGMQHNTSWAVEQLDSLIDHRYVHKLETVFTTNVMPSELPPRIASRIKEGEVVQLTGCDYRELKAGRRLGERISK